MKIIINIILIYIFVTIVCYRYLIKNHDYFLIMIELSNEEQKKILGKYSEYNNYKRMMLYISLIPFLNIFFVFLIKKTIDTINKIK